ncbi:MAG: hypothetical protein HY831_05390 [Candidatus Aenigmarchaeota archaeon]|nr:hypothetical protein [Candidatus Aenigmarchaeota archaeon]
MIVGFNINSIKARTNTDNVNGEISVNSAPVIIDVERKDVDELKDILSIKFTFKVEYKPDAGEIKIEGEVLYKSENSKDILKKWKDTKTLPSDVAVDVLNGVFRGCLIKAVSLSGDLRLPPPVRFPIVAKEPRSEKE